MKKASIALLLALFFFSGCATHTLVDNVLEPPGFFVGLWHGLCIYFSVIGGFFNDAYKVYAFPNRGFYDAGFALGVLILNATLFTVLQDE